mgnify:CR=1 FL=1
MNISNLRFTGQRFPVPTDEWIRFLRKRLQLSQSRFAQMYGLDLKSLQQWEQGRRQPEQGTCLLLLMIDYDSEEVERLVTAVRRATTAPS